MSTETTTDAVAIVLDNHRETHDRCLRLARGSRESARSSLLVKDGTWTAEESKIYILADSLKNYLEEFIFGSMPLSTPREAMIAQLTRSAFGDIDWHELARHYLTKLEDTER